MKIQITIEIDENLFQKGGFLTSAQLTENVRQTLQAMAIDSQSLSREYSGHDGEPNEKNLSKAFDQAEIVVV